jgi:ribosomal protein S18 acetylase RimI-like enzyme
MIRNGTDMVEPIVTPHGVLRLRPETAGDRAFLYTLYDSIKGAELALAGISGPLHRQLLDMQFRAMTMGYQSSFPTGRFAIVTLDDAPIGRLITDTDPARCYIVHIGLLPEWRQHGIGIALMTAVLEKPRRQGFRCEAIVALDNLPSQRLWTRLGFTERERGDTNMVMAWTPA